MRNLLDALAAIHSTFWLSTISPFSIALLLKALASGFFVSLLFSRSSRGDVDKSLTQNVPLFSAFMDNLPAFAWIKDIEGRYVYVNKLLIARVTAFQSRWLGKTDADLWPGEIGATYHANDLKVVASRETLETVETYLLDGERRYLLVSKFPILDHNGAVTMVGGTGVDITAHQRAEDALREAENKYRDIFENAVEGIFQTTPGGRFITANPALTRMLGYDSTEELLNSRTDIARQHYVEPALRLEFKRMLDEDGVIRKFEHRAYRKDGRKIWFSENVRSVCDVDGVVLYYEGFTEDITARKQAEEERDRLFNLSLDPLCVAGFDGYFKQVNPAWTQTLGWSEAELLSRPWIEFVHPDDQEATVKAGAALIASQSVLGFENRYQHKDGSYRWFAWSAFPLFEARLIFAVVRDITGRKQAEEEKEQLLDNEREARLQAVVMRDANLALIRDLSLERVLETLLDYLHKLVPYDSANVMLVEDDSKFVVSAIKGYETFLSDVDVAKANEFDANSNLLFAQIHSTGSSLLIADTKQEPHWQCMPGGEHTRNWIGVPLIAYGKIIGLYSLDKAEPGYFTREHVKLAESLAASAASAIENARLFHQGKLFRNLIDRSNDAIEVLDPTTLRFLDCNTTAHQTLGYTREEFLSLSAFDIDPIIDESMLARLGEEMDKSAFAIFESVHRRKDGSTFPVEINATTIRLERDYRLAVVRDITERKRAEAALQESEERYRDLVENSHEFICTHDLDGRILSANRIAVQLLGYDPKDLIGKRNIRDILAPQVRDQFEDYMAQILKEGATGGMMLVQTSSGEHRVWEYYNSLRTEGVKAPIVRGIARDVTEQRRAEKVMSDLRHELELTMNSMEEGVHRVDLTRNIVFENPAAARMLGWEVAELLGKPAHLTMHHTRPDGTPYPKEECPIYETLRDGITRQVTDEVFWRRDGTSFPVEYMTAPMRNDRNEIVATVVTFRDITERKRAEEALKQSEQHFRNLFEQAHDAIIVLNPEHEIVLDVNQRACEVYGFSRLEFIGMSLEAISKDVVRGKNKIAETLERGDYLNFETVQYRKDGSEMFLEINASTILYQGQLVILSINRDVTERKRAEAALRESEERYRELFENAKDTIYVHDLNGIYTSVNRAAEQLTGYSRAEIIGKHFSDFLAPEYLPRVRNHLGKKLIEQRPTSFEVEVIARDGRRVLVEFSSNLVCEDGVPVGVQGIARDITERKRAAELLQTFPRRLIEAQEAERKRIARELHDEIGQVLTAISLNLQAVRASGLTPTSTLKIEESILVVDDALHHVQNLALELRPSLLDDLGLAAAIRWFVDCYAQRTGIKPEVTMDVQIADGRLSRELETACFRIVQEALTNVARHAEAQTVSVHLRALSDETCISIKDDGVGFDGSAGNGATPIRLGLRGMEERALALGGKLEIKSAPARGTEILAYFPNENKKD